MSRVLFWTSSSLSDRHLAIFVTCSAASLIYFSKFSKRFLFTLCSTCFTVSNFPCYFILNSSLFSKLENIGELNTLVRIWNKRGGYTSFITYIGFLYYSYITYIIILFHSDDVARCEETFIYLIKYLSIYGLISCSVLGSIVYKVQVKRRTSHESNPMQMYLDKRLS